MKHLLLKVIGNQTSLILLRKPCELCVSGLQDRLHTQLLFSMFKLGWGLGVTDKETAEGSNEVNTSLVDTTSKSRVSLSEGMHF